jgi:hypothetical protein
MVAVDHMTADDFRSVALGFPGAVESAHMNHPDFRIGGKVFATLGYPDESWAMVKLTPEQQRSFVQDGPLVFRPWKGVWGERGATNLRLESATKAEARAALETAWRNLGSKAKKPTS